MSTFANGGGLPQGVVQLPPGASFAPGGVQVQTGQPFHAPAPQPVIPTGQQVQTGGQQITYGVDQLPAAPQQSQQGTFPNQGFVNPPQQQNYGLPQQYAGQPAPQGGAMPGSQPQPQWGQQPQAPQWNLQTRLQGPNIPQALQGRTLGEAFTIYQALETDWAQRQRAGATPAGQSLQQMQAPQGQPAGYGQQTQVQGQSGFSGAGAGPQPGGQRPQANAWTNPEQFFGSLLDQKLDERLAPVVQFTQQQAIGNAFQMARSGLADFQTLEADIMQIVAQADPQSLANPATWLGAADIARGRAVREGRYQPPQVQGQQPQQRPQMPGMQPPSMVGAQPAGQMAPTPAYGFFTEAPTPPQSGFGLPAAGQPTPQDVEYAQKFRMPIGDYMAWKHGVTQNSGSAAGGGR